MKRKNIITYCIMMIVSIVLTIFAIVPINNDYSDIEPWMKKVDDNTLINDLSIPGTHDSGATHSIFDIAGKCQDLSINEQVNMGVRFFDIRLQLVNDEFNVVHSFVDQKLKFKDVIKCLYDYIKYNASEFLIISIKKEEESLSSTKTFEEALLEDFSQYQDVVCFDKQLPKTVKEARGKIFLISRYNSSIGVDAYVGWKDSTTFELNNFYIQDNYCIDDIEDKKNDIMKTLSYSNNNHDKLVLNFTSCYLDNAFPPSYSGTAASIINPWFNNLIKDNNDCLGVVIVDFMTNTLAQNIYKRNIK